MVLEFKDELIGERIILKRTISSMAKVMFDTVDSNREHLSPWFPWEKLTVKVEDTKKYIEGNEEKLKEGKMVEYGIYVRDKYMGNISCFNISEKDKSGEMGYWISSEFTRKGYVTEAVKVLEKELFEHLDFNRIRIKCDDRNEPSSGVAKKCGYVFEGKMREDSYSEHFGDFRNTILFSKLKSEYVHNS